MKDPGSTSDSSGPRSAGSANSLSPRPSSQERRTRILDVASRVFARHGYRQTDVQVIADELGVGKGTVYRHFPTKQELFLSSVDRMMQRLSKDIDAARAGQDDPLDQLAGAIRAYLGFFDRESDAIELILQERAEFKQRPKPTYFQHREANLGRWLELIGGLIEQGRVKAFRPESIVNVLSNVLYGTIFTNHFAGRKIPLEQQATEIIDITFCGILTPRELERRGASTPMDRMRGDE